MPRPKRCPTCHQPLLNDSSTRICARCHKPIERHDKWQFITADGQTLIQHRDCEHPREYDNPTNKKATLNQLEFT